MDVVFGFVGHIEIDDVRDVGQVESARHDVGCDQDQVFALLELADGFEAVVLRFVGVNDAHLVGEARFQSFINLVGQFFGTGKNQHFGHVQILRDQHFQQVDLRMEVRHRVGSLRDAGQRRSGGGCLDAQRVVEMHGH